MEEVIHHNQYCGRNGKTIYDAVATVRDIIAYAEVSNTSLCLLSIDFSDAFNKISHAFLFKILEKCGISKTFCQRLQNIYEGATSSLKMNGHKSNSISINGGVRQGCPLSMLLFATCINPLLTTPDKWLKGIKVNHNSHKKTAIAYADDVTIVIRHPEEIDVIREIMHNYMDATVANINETKSSALALGSWPQAVPIMNIKYVDNIKLLGFQMATNSNKSAKMSWKKLTSQALEIYHRSLDLASRIRYVNEVLLATAWYTAQILPPPK